MNPFKNTFKKFFSKPLSREGKKLEKALIENTQEKTHGQKSMNHLGDPTLRANPFPEVTDLICRLPLPTLF